MPDLKSGAEICERLIAGPEDDIPMYLWEAASGFYRYSKEERGHVLNIINELPTKYRGRYRVLFWLLHFINHAGPCVDSQTRGIFLNILLGLLKSDDIRLVKKALESLACMNYLLSDSQLEKTVMTLKDFCVATTDETCYEDLLICCASLYDYTPETMKPALGATIDDFQNLAGEFSYFNEYPPVSPEEQASVVFFIPEFLSGKSFLQPPIGALTSATILKQAGVTVRVIDNRVYHLKLESVIQILKKLNCKCIVLISTPYDQVSIYYCDYRWYIIQYNIAYFKQNDFKVILCGSHGTVQPEMVHLKTGVDIIIKGEWDIVVGDLVAALSRRGWSNRDLAGVSNIAYFDGKTLVHTPLDMQKLHPPMENLPIPDYSLVNMQAYFGDEYINNYPYVKFGWGSILAQRGCPFRCNFCYNFFGTKVRRRTPKQVVDEMEILVKEYKVTHLFFIDYTFTTSKAWAMEVCEEIIRRNLQVAWNCETRADCVDPELLELMRRAHCHRIWLGVETFSDSLLKNCQKQISEEQMLQAIQQIQNSGIRVSCFLMLGLPGETCNSISYTTEKIRETSIEYTKSIITVIPRFGTKLYERARKYIREETFEEIYEVRGLVDNDITAKDLTNAIQLMASRHVISEGANDAPR